MNAIATTPLNVVPLERRDFDALRELIRGLSGIHLHDGKRSLVTGRLQRRLRALGLASFSAYIDYVSHDTSGDERRELVNAITTNKTSFFREAHHFDFLMRTIVPEAVARAAAGGPKRLRIWSAACSTGQEPWSLAMALQQSLGVGGDWDVRILASDLDTDVLRVAEEGAYSAEAIAEVPPAFRAAAFVNAGNDTFRISRELRRLVTFRQINLVDGAWPIRSQFDAIFCRNVAIYFDRPTQQTLFERLAKQLVPRGYLFSGHSENLHWLRGLLAPVGSTIHRLKEPAPEAPVEARVPRPHAPHPPQIAVHAGGVQASARRVILRTLLGSCVAVCLYDPHKRIGGMNHFMLPSGQSAVRMPACYGIHAMELLINELMKLGSDREHLIAKVFGASQLRDDSCIAADNAEFAVSYLGEEGIPIAARKTGDTLPLLVYFDTGTGVARVRKVAKVAEVTRAESRLSALSSAEAPPLEEGITFFGGSP